MPILEASQALQTAAETIKAGNLVAFPTETVYGLGANALDAAACVKIFEKKKRPFFDPLIVHITDASQVSQLADDTDPRVKILSQKFWPGPLTLLLPKKECVPDIVTAGLPTVALRCPSHPVAHQLINLSGVPIAAPSANPFGYVSPTTAQHVLDSLGDDLLILDGGECESGIESTILDLTQDPALLLRPGIITLEQLQSLIPCRAKTNQEEALPSAPGLLKHHYAPNKPVFLSEEFSGNPAEAVWLGLKQPKDKNFSQVISLSESGDLTEAAHRLFACLRQADQSKATMIVMNLVPQIGIGVAINDRLRKACGQ